MPGPNTSQEPEIPANAAGGPLELGLTVSEPADVGPLFRRLRAVPGATVTRRRSGPGGGELGVTEVLQLLVPSSAVLAVAIRTLPVFIKSRRSSVTVTITRDDRSVTLTGENLDDPQKILDITDRLLGHD
ncbi:hypothetical protein [Streptomyces albus]|uniref:effector-associated constant component EACC1 n=1 Tax=Streptomyces albus TaxID=1888 RepID=UPI00068C6DE6|nr:hypothetical protein [Streptomyces albus]